MAYGELVRRVDAHAGRLATLGVGPGERLALLAENSLEWVEAFLAGLARGAVVVPLNTRLGPRELARQLDLVAPRLVLATETCLPLLERAAPAAPVRRLEHDGLAPGALRSAQPAAGALAVPGAEPALISFTSGATGEPKGAVISHAALVAAVRAYTRTLGTGPGDSTLVLVPLFHNTGFLDQVLHLLTVGGSVEILGRYSTGAAVDALARRPASYLIAVPSMLRLLGLDPRADAVFGGCRILAYGGSPMPPAWIADICARWPRLRPFDIYGLTEFTSLSHACGPEHVLSRPGSVGRPVEGARQRIVEADGRVLPPDEEGELQLAGPTRMLRYWRAPQATARALDGPWLRTGDLGAVDADGFLTVRGRIAEVINRGGEKIYATRVEAALSGVPGVAEAAVVGTPDPILHERVSACILERPGTAFDEAAARALLAEELPDYAVPERFVVLDELPRNAAGKLDRRALRELLVGEPA